jgi:hypothetical protein
VPLTSSATECVHRVDLFLFFYLGSVGLPASTAEQRNGYRSCKYSTLWACVKPGGQTKAFGYFTVAGFALVVLVGLMRMAAREDMHAWGLLMGDGRRHGVMEENDCRTNGYPSFAGHGHGKANVSEFRGGQ